MEVSDILFVVPVFVVPAIDRVSSRFAQFNGGTLDGNEFVLRSWSGVSTDVAPYRVRFDHVQRQFSDQNRRRFQVNTFVFDAHQNDPHGAVPLNRHGKITFTNEFVNDLASRITVGFYFGGCGPIVVIVVQVIPRHFVDANSEHRFDFFVDALVDQVRHV